MAKQHWKGSVLLAPVPQTLVSCGTMESHNVLTVAWTGVLATHPPMTYISVRPTRHSYGILMEQREFVINLTTSAMMKETDFCGVRSGKDVDKFQVCHFTPEPAQTVQAPLIGNTHRLFRRDHRCQCGGNLSGQQGKAELAAVRSDGICPRRIFCAGAKAGELRRLRAEAEKETAARKKERLNAFPRTSKKSRCSPRFSQTSTRYHLTFQGFMI